MTIYVHLAVQYTHTHTHKYTIQRHTGRHKVIDTHTDTSIKKRVVWTFVQKMTTNENT